MSLFLTLAPLRTLALARPHLAAASAGVASARSHASASSSSVAFNALGAEAEELEFAPDDEEFVAAEPLFMTTLTFSEEGIQAMLKKKMDREKVRTSTDAGHPRHHNTFRWVPSIGIYYQGGG